jgi:SpoVK/Ycf46/Vps4 family AAA+-type ATPase
MLYGPPGNGKTLLACAIARNLGATFFNVKASQIVSKWVGESGKLIAALYRMARRFSRDGPPSIIFIDEFDALCQDRGNGSQLHHRQMLSSILSELDGFSHKGNINGAGRVLTLGATNRPWDLDPAALSRFERRMHIPLPEVDARRRIFEIHLGMKGILIESDANFYTALAERSERLSGREIARLCKEVVSRMLAETNSEIPSLVDSGSGALQAFTLRMRPLTLGDFLPLLAVSNAETDAQEEQRFRNWGLRSQAN